MRKRIEEAFGWAKSAAGLRKTKHRGLGRVGWQFTFTMAAYNLVRLPKLLAATGCSPLHARNPSRAEENARKTSSEDKKLPYQSSQ